MQAKFTEVRDTLTPDLQALYQASNDKVGIHRAIGLGLVSLAKRAFNDASLRPKPWAPKKDGTMATLRKSGTLAKSIRVVRATSRSVTVGSDRRYAAIHQLGGKKRKMPARPYLPFEANGGLTVKGQRSVKAVVMGKLKDR